MSRLKIQLCPNLQDGGQFVTQVGRAPLIHRGGVYSLNYEESMFRRISIFRYKNGWLHRRMKGPIVQPTNKRTVEVGQLALLERRGLKALGMENKLLQDPGTTPMVLTSDGFLQPHQPNTPKEAPPPAPFDFDPFLAHEELRGKSVAELKEYFEGPLNEEGVPAVTPEVNHVSQVVAGQ